MALCFGVAAMNAGDTKTCKVSGTSGEVGAAVYASDCEKGEAIVEFANDTDERVTIHYTISWGNETRSGVVVAQPNQSTTKKVVYGKSKCSCNPPSLTSISGTKCN